MNKTACLFLLCIFFRLPAGSQPWLDKLPEKKSAAPAGFFEYRKAFNDYHEEKGITGGPGYKQFKRWEWFMQNRIDPEGYYHPEMLWKASAARSLPGTKKSKGEVSWTYTGPAVVPRNPATGQPIGMGRIDAIAFHPSDPDTWWIGSPTGGVWKTTDNGLTWTCLTDRIPLIGIGDIAVHPDDPDIIYIGTGDRDATDLDGIGVLKTTDGGLNWETTGLSFEMHEKITVNRLLIRPGQPDTILAATDQGIYFSGNAGAAWTPVLPGKHIKDMEFKPDDPDIVLAAGYGSFPQIYRSTDAGKNFLESSSSVINSTYARRIALAVTPANPNMVFAVVSKTDGGFLGLYRSTNFGSQWTRLTSGDDINLLSNDPSGRGEGGQGWYDLSVAVDPEDPQTVYVGGINLWKTDNAGYHWELLTFGYPEWEQSDEPYVHVDHHALEWHPLTGVLYNGNDGGIYRSNDGGETWEDLSDGLHILQIYRIGSSLSAPGRIMTGSQDNGTFANFSAAWAEMFGGDGMECIIHPLDTLILYASFQRGNLIKSYDGGITWYSIKPAEAPEGAWITPFVMNPQKPDVLYAGYDEVYKTTDGGSTWKRVSNFLPADERIYSLALCPAHPEVVYAANRTDVWRTVNGGESWNLINNNLPQQLSKPITYITVSQEDHNAAWITLGGYDYPFYVSRVYMTRNGGKNWFNYSENLPDVPVNCVVYEKHSNDAVYVGTDIGVFYRNASMDEWIPCNEGLPNVIVNEMEIDYSRGKILAGTYGRGLWESDLYHDNSGSLYAAFAVDRISSCAESPMHFTSQSSGDIDSLRWDFGQDASPPTSTLGEVDVTYPTAGIRTISLTVYRNGEQVTETRPGFVKAVTDITVNVLPEEGIIPLGTGITLEASGADQYVWTPTGGLDNPEEPVVYASPGTETLYTVTGTQGMCEDQATVRIIVYPNDSVCNATRLEWGENGPFYNHRATVEENEPFPDSDGANACATPLKWCSEGGLQHSVWFLFDGPAGGTVSIDSRGFDNQIAVYDAESCDDILQGQATLIAAFDDYYGENQFYAAAIETIEGLVPGKTYYVQVDGSAGGVEGVFYLSLYDSPLDIYDIPGKENKGRIILYPNPAGGSFTLQWNGLPETDYLTVSVYTLSGKQVYLLNIPHPRENGTYPVSTSLPEGMYLLRVGNQHILAHLKLILE
ncbi:MAG TPA: T9SS type A sorting domain-containing protein [Bacteroidetes bacterium]|nr:T9SS type A sorting domain-containing protein [Bacteroidota bacterium]